MFFASELIVRYCKDKYDSAGLKFSKAFLINVL
jgi:hypothetical protein